MKNQIFLTMLMSIVSLSAGAQNCKKPGLQDFAAYAIETMDLRSSDYQGLAGAGQGIKSENFLFEGNAAVCLAASSGGPFELRSGQAWFGVEADTMDLSHVLVKGDLVARRSATLSNSTVRGVVVSLSRPILANSSIRGRRSRPVFQVSHIDLAEQLRKASVDMAALLESSTVDSRGGAIVIEGRANTVVAHLSADAVSAIRRVVLRGSERQNFVINLWGANVSLVNFQVILEGGVTPAQISWNLPTTKTLLIHNTHDGVIGIPGAIYAPEAVTEFYDGLLTGALYVRRIVFDARRGFAFSGQINRTRVALPPGTRPFN